MENEILQQLIILNKNIETLSQIVSHKSFFNSQLFAAIIGSSSAVIVLIVQVFIKWKENRNKRLDEIYKWAAEQIDFFSPVGLYREASNTTYISTTHDKKGKLIDTTPEKLLGEKMIIELRMHVKYWRFPNSKFK